MFLNIKECKRGEDCMSQQEKTIRAYACSGCADVGEIADQVCRKLRKGGFASSQMSCLIGVGAGIPAFVDAAKTSDLVITVDGCEAACAQKLIQKNGIQPHSVILTRFGLEKGNAQISVDLVNSLNQKIIEQISQI